jgi:hypothetical protein
MNTRKDRLDVSVVDCLSENVMKGPCIGEGCNYHATNGRIKIPK